MVNQAKIEFVKQLEEELKESSVIVVAENSGLTVSEITELRRNLREKEARFRIVKNTLSKIALKNLGFSDQAIEEMFQGPVGIAYTQGDPVAAVKAVHEFTRKIDRLKMKGGILEGQLLDAAQMKVVAQLPGREELIAKLLYLMKWPVQGFVNVMIAPVRSFVTVLDAINTKKQEGGE